MSSEVTDAPSSAEPAASENAAEGEPASGRRWHVCPEGACGLAFKVSVDSVCAGDIRSAYLQRQLT